jgi:RNA polymerase sigma-70 factor (ECF subfamily)
MAAADTFDCMMERLRCGDDAAAREVFERFTWRLVALARGRFNRVLTRKVDAEDVVQSAYRSFFVRQREGKLEVCGWDGLWNLLTLITLRKCADRAEYFLADRRDATREWTGPDGEEMPDISMLALDREPQPEEAAILAETVEHVFRDLSVHERPILELSLQGYTASEISNRLGRAERSVRRLREQIRKRLERLNEAD